MLKWLHICDPRTQEVGARGSEIQCYIELQSNFKASLGYIRSCLKQTNRTKKAC